MTLEEIEGLRHDIAHAGDHSSKARLVMLLERAGLALDQAARGLQEEPVLPCALVIGNGTFHAGVAVSTAQGAIDRMFKRMESLERELEQRAAAPLPPEKP